MNPTRSNPCDQQLLHPAETVLHALYKSTITMSRKNAPSSRKQNLPSWVGASHQTTASMTCLCVAATPSHRSRTLPKRAASKPNIVSPIVYLQALLASSRRLPGGTTYGESPASVHGSNAMVRNVDRILYGLEITGSLKEATVFNERDVERLQTGI